MIEDLKPLMKKLMSFASHNIGFKQPPKLFLKQDKKNSMKILGKTAHYDPQEEAVTLYVTGRHPKDILRSLAHELVHHSQNLRGEFDKPHSTGPGYAQKDPHMRNMEKEAYLKGNMCFRDFEDSLHNKDIYILKIAESKFLKENKAMTKKITKDFLKEKIRQVLEEKIDEMHCGTGGKRKKRRMKEEEEKKETETSATDTGDTNDDKESETGPKDVKSRRDQVENPGKYFNGPRAKAGADTDGDGIPDGEDSSPLDGNKNEGKIITPEQHQSLYENRFSSRNQKLYTRLLKEWTK